MDQEIEDRWGISGEARHKDGGVRVIDVLMIGELLTKEFFVEFAAENILGFGDDFKQRVVLEDEVEIDIVFPLGPSAQSESFHGGDGNGFGHSERRGKVGGMGDSKRILVESQTDGMGLNGQLALRVKVSFLDGVGGAYLLADVVIVE